MKTFRTLVQRLKESKYADAMTSRLPAHLEDPRQDKKETPAPKWEKKDYDAAAENYKHHRKGRKSMQESSWESYRAQVLNEARLDVPTHTPETLAKRHKVSVDHIHTQLKRGTEVEHEHTTDPKVAREIALDHLGEHPSYYMKLDKAQLEETMTPREKMSGMERLKPKEKPAVDAHKKNSYTSNTGAFSYRKFSKDRSAHPEKFIAGLNGSTNESYNVAFNESGEKDSQRSQYVQHYNLFRKHEYEAATDSSQIPSREHHRKALTHLYSKMSPEDRKSLPHHLRLSESAEPYKVGDKVVANIGPHKGTVHTVIHVHPTGHLNIKPDVAHVSRNKYRLGAAKADPKDVTRHLAEAKGCPVPNNRGKQFKKWPKGMHTTNTGINRKTIQEIFQAAKDKKDGQPPKEDALPNDGANEPNKDIPGAGAPGVQPQDSKGSQDGAPGVEKKKDNTPKPENPNSKKIQVKGPGADDKFQPDPQVTPLTHMPDTGNPRNGSAATR